MTRANRLKRAAPLLIAACAATLVLLGRPADATVGFSYAWKTPRVAVNWSEGSESPELPALRRQVGHWKRLAHTLWAKYPAAPPLRMDVTLYGPEMGSEGPLITLRAGGRTTEIKAPITEEGVFEALLKVRGGPTETLPPDDAEPAISRDGQWVAHLSWRGSGPEVWVSKRDASTVTRVPFVGGGGLMDRLVLLPPVWAASAQQVAWVQGGRLVIFDTRQRVARYVTPADRQVTQFQWSPKITGPIVVVYDDERFDLLDGVSGSAVPVSDLLKGAAPMGRFFWSGSGQRLLFRTQSRIEVAGLTLPGKASSMWDRFLNRALGGPPDPPQRQEGEQEERLAVLDLRARRLDAYPVKGTPLETGEITSVTWSPDEQTVFAVASEEDEGSSLVRFPLQKAGTAATVMTSAERLVALGWRSDRMTQAKTPDPALAKYAVLKGEEVLVSEDGKSYTAPYSPAELLKFELPAGPQGGYLGVEGEVLTEDEPVQTLFIESMQHTGLEAMRRTFPHGLLLTYTLDSPAMPMLKQLMDRKPVFADLVWDRGQSLTMAVLSEGGGVGEMLGVGIHPMNEQEAVEMPLSRDLARATILASNPIDQPYALTDVNSGTSTLALRFAQFDPRRLLLYSVLILAVLAALVFVLRKRLAR